MAGSALLDSRAVALADAVGEHRRSRHAGQCVCSAADKFFKPIALFGQDQSRTRAELAGTKSKRTYEGPPDCGPSSSQGFGEKDHGIDRTHLGINRNGLIANGRDL